MLIKLKSLVEFFKFLDRPGGTLGPWVRIWSQFFDTTFTWSPEGRVEDTIGPPPNMYIKWKVSSSRTTLLLEPSPQNAPFRQELKVKLKTHLKCMGNVWKNCLNCIFQHEATLRFIFDVQQSCRSRNSVSFRKRLFSNPSGQFREQLKLKFKLLSR